MTSLSVLPSPEFDHYGDGAHRELSPAELDALDDRVLLGFFLDQRLGIAAGQASATALLDRFGDLGSLAAADGTEVARVPGICRAVIHDLKLLRTLAVRLSRSQASRRPVLSSWDALRTYAVTALAHLPREQFRALYLDRRNILLRDEVVADGTVDHAPVYPREVIRRALEVSASALILIHNHPSGDPTPSQADITMTRQIVDAAKLFGLQVHDHLVVGREGTSSFRALGLM